MLTVAELNRMAADTGCAHHNDCLTCPLSACIYDNGCVSAAVRFRHEKIRSMFPSKSEMEIAIELGISVRTVQRALKEKLNG